MRTATLKELYELHEAKKLCGVFMIPNNVYHAAPGLSKSALDNLEESPAYFKWRLTHPEDPTEALIVGSYYHAAIYEPQEIERLFFPHPTQPKQAKRDERGRIAIAERNVTMVNEMIAVLKTRERAWKLTRGIAEISFFWTDPETGIQCKCKPDSWFPNLALVNDSKTLNKRPTLEVCSREMLSRRHHVQGAFILDGIRYAIAQSGMEIDGYVEPDKFILSYQHKDEDYDVADRVCGPTSLVHGEAEYRRNLETYARCVRDNVWPGVAGVGEMQEFDLPLWKLKEGI